MSDDIKQQFWKALADSPNVMVGATGEREHHIPMNAQLDKDANGAFWFFTATNNRLAAGGPAMAQFAAKGQIGRASCRERGFSTCRSRWSPDHSKKNNINNTIE